MPFTISDGRWEATCARCFVSSSVVAAKTQDEAADKVRATGWLSAQPDGGTTQWWCHECRGKLFEVRRKGRKR